MSEATELQLAHDIRRSLILGSYMRCWGLPKERTVSRRGNDVIEVYCFEGSSTSELTRFATVGLSGIRNEVDVLQACELFMVLPKGLAGATSKQVVDFTLDVAVYSLDSEVRFRIGRTIPETPLMPASWKPRALFLDEPRGEPEEVATFHVGSQCVELIWLIPIYLDEYNLIQNGGPEAFYYLERTSEFSPADPSRASFVGPRTPTD